MHANKHRPTRNNLGLFCYIHIVNLDKKEYFHF